MPLSEAFKKDLNEVYKELGGVRRRFAALKGAADLDGLPPEISTQLQRKAGQLAYIREDLAEIPRLVAQAEARR